MYDEYDTWDIEVDAEAYAEALVEHEIALIDERMWTW